MASYTESQVRAWFLEANKPIATVDASGMTVETEAQRLARITQQLNAGTVTEDEVKAAIAKSTGTVDPNAAATYGGRAAAHRQEVTGGNGELWFDGSQWYMVFGVPGTDTFLYYPVSNPAALFPEGATPQPDRRVTSSFLDINGFYGGIFEELQVGNPYNQYIAQLEAEAKINPALLDPDVLLETFEAALEGRPVRFANIAGSQWWKDHSQTERDWLTLSYSDPMTAAQSLQAGRIQTAIALEAAGVANVPPELAAFMADQRVKGLWTDAYYNNQIRAVSDPYSGVAIDPDLAEAISGLQIDTTRQYESQVRDEVSRWLGPLYGDWDQSQISWWAGRYRNDPDATENLRDLLKAQRLAMFPEYENENLTYEDIAGPWRNMWSSVWGRTPDETDPLFVDIVRLNDAGEAGMRLREEGLNRGVSTVFHDLERAALSTGNQVRRSF